MDNVRKDEKEKNSDLTRIGEQPETQKSGGVF